MKKCTKCFSIKPLLDFSFKNKSKGTYKSSCKDCDSLVSKIHYGDNKELYKSRSKEWKKNNPRKNLANRYKVSVSEIDDLFEKSGNKCEICESTFRLCVDHCHTSGRIRGILCTKCNLALGLIFESKEILTKLESYIDNKIRV